MTEKTERMAGPVVPGWTTWMTRLWPWRIKFDSLGYIHNAARQFGGLFAIWVGNRPTYVVTDPELAHDILVRRANEFHKAELLRHAVQPLIGNGLLISEDDFWKRQRKLAQPAFHHQRIEAYGATMVDYTAQMLARWHAGESRDIAQEMMGLALAIVNKTLFNMDLHADSERIGALMLTALEAANDRINGYEPIWERLTQRQARREAAALAELFAIVDAIIAGHRRQEQDTGDLLSMLLAARDENGDPMSEKQLHDEVTTLFIAGHETTANALAWAFYLLAQNPAADERLQRELSLLDGQLPTVKDLSRLPYTEMVIKEAMRLYPPAGGVTRQPIHDIELGGRRIARGSDIAISTYAMHRNPDLFADPEHFDPERFSAENEPKLPKYAYLPFGGGPRICIGNSFAMLEARLIMATVLQRYKLSLLPGQTVRAEQIFTIRPRGGIKMVVEARLVQTPAEPQSGQ